MDFYVYVIRNEVGKIYIGQTNNLKTRLLRHNKILPSKNTSYTSKNGASWVIVYKELYLDRMSARRREKELKSYRGREFIKNIISRP